MARPGTGVATTEGRLSATGAGGIFVVEADFTVGSTSGLKGLPQNVQSALEKHTADFPTKVVDFNYVTEIELPSSSLKLDPTAPNPAVSTSRWVPPGAEGAKVVRHWKIKWVEDPRGFTRLVLEGPFEGPPTVSGK